MRRQIMDYSVKKSLIILRRLDFDVFTKEVLLKMNIKTH